MATHFESIQEIHLKPKKTLFYSRDDQTLEQVAQEFVEPPPLELLKTQLDLVLGNLL